MSIFKLTLLIAPAFVWSLCLGSPGVAAKDDATKISAGQRAASAIEQRDAETEIRQHMPIMALERRSETATANNRHNLSVIDNVLGKALEILSLAFGVAIIGLSVAEQKEKREAIVSIAVGTGFVLFGLFCPPIIHALCEWVSRSLFH
ncbi:MAG: hypothetical protein DKT66_01335 [Candidatus Melainabacteria bacterium]|nr:MAG: hypothetical protein DKT66_01335 [Candidatus Melainabacteria bacterium]